MNRTTSRAVCVLRVIVMASALCALTACASGDRRAMGPAVDVVDGLPVSGQPVPGDDRVQVGDLVEVTVLGQPDLTRAVRVTTTGDISLPLIGGVQATGRTAIELEQAIAEALRTNYLRNPQVSVFVKERVSRRITVSGAVRNPGLYPVEPGTTLLQAIAIAEGFDPLADERAVVVFRPTPAGRMAAVFDMRAIHRGQSPDPALLFGDIVVVEQSASKTALRRFIETVPAVGVFGLFR